MDQPLARRSALGAGLLASVTSLYVLPDGDILTNDIVTSPAIYGAVRWDGSSNGLRLAIGAF